VKQVKARENTSANYSKEKIARAKKAVCQAHEKSTSFDFIQLLNPLGADEVKKGRDQVIRIWVNLHVCLHVGYCHVVNKRDKDQR
jgi:hypothetical protein